jgi:hypothetical protein
MRSLTTLLFRADAAILPVVLSTNVLGDALVGRLAARRPAR